MDRQREWDEAVRLHFYNQENELFLHGGWSPITMEMLFTCSSYLLHSCCVQYLRGIPQSRANSAVEKTVSDIIVYHCCYGSISMVTTPTVRIYQRRGARRWKKVRRVNGHGFVAKRFQTAYCEKCHDRIWGLGRQGYRCEACKMTVHKRCAYFLKPEEVCKGHPVSTYVTRNTQGRTYF